MIMVDSSVWIDFFNGVENIETDKLDEMLGLEEIATGDLIITEVLQGFKSDKDFKVAKRTSGGIRTETDGFESISFLNYKTH